MNINKLIDANTKLLNEKEVLERDVKILEKRIENAKKYCESNKLQEVIQILDGEEIE